ncbi:hypothetical protein V5799_004070 [Amblyomma americanum]|uniref:Beta-galactosidase n=1 Tax=Amblyomma americanum TaxID=6943 RepID=A0AAQ4D755_AMBAM
MQVNAILSICHLRIGKLYVEYVERYFSNLLPLLRPLLYINGGPIIAVQIENEYGSYHACDFVYTTWLRDLVRRHLGNGVILYTIDGAQDRFLKCGKIDGVYVAINFGRNDDIEEAFKAQRRHQERGPLMNAEFYPGWFDLWAERHETESTSKVAHRLDKMLSMNASVVLFMFHGGTSFGYKSGAHNNSKGFRTMPTSYDYDAPMTEAGDPTDKFIAIRNVISKYMAVPSTPVPEPKEKMALGKIALKQSQALVLYDTWVSFTPRNPAVLSVPGLRDRGYVYVDDIYQGVISRMDNVYEIMVPVTKGQRLTVVVENQGRVNYGNLNDPKGIISDVTLSGKTLTDWNMTRIDERNHMGESSHPVRDGVPSMCGASAPGLAVYEARFQLLQDPPLDTFIRLDHWKKGAVILNGFNLGRYWTPMGPQKTLYVPSVLFKPNNILNVIELEQAPCSEGSGNCFVEFVDKPEINATVP